MSVVQATATSAVCAVANLDGTVQLSILEASRDLENTLG